MRKLLVPLVLAAACANGRDPANGNGGLSEDEFKALHELSGDSRAAPRGAMVEIAATKAYLAEPEQDARSGGGVVVIHEWWGLNDHVKHWCDRLAEEGHVALAVDLYEGKVATTPDEANELRKAVDDARAVEVLEAAHAFLNERAARTGVIGWCFGGGWSLRAAMEIPQLDACVVYYGHLVTDPEELKAIRCPLLGVFGNEDTAIPPEKVDEFGKALQAAGVKHEILRYDAPHAFANPSSARYRHDAAEDAWKRVRTFLDERLGR